MAGIPNLQQLAAQDDPIDPTKGLPSDFTSAGLLSGVSTTNADKNKKLLRVEKMMTDMLKRWRASTMKSVSVIHDLEDQVRNGRDRITMLLQKNAQQDAIIQSLTEERIALYKEIGRPAPETPDVTRLAVEASSPQRTKFPADLPPMDANPEAILNGIRKQLRTMSPQVLSSASKAPAAISSHAAGSAAAPLTLLPGGLGVSGLPAGGRPVVLPSSGGAFPSFTQDTRPPAQFPKDLLPPVSMPPVAITNVPAAGVKAAGLQPPRGPTMNTMEADISNLRAQIADLQKSAEDLAVL